MLDELICGKFCKFHLMQDLAIGCAFRAIGKKRCDDIPKLG